MFEPDEEEIKKKCIKIFILQKNISDSCNNLKKLVKEKKWETVGHRDKKRKTSM